MSSSSDVRAVQGPEVTPARALFDRLFVLVRTVAVHGDAHPLSAQTAAHLAESLDAASPPFALQFVSQAVFRDFTLVSLDPATFLRAQRVTDWLARMGVNEVGVDYVPDTPSLLALGRAFAQGSDKPPEVPGLRLRRIGRTQAGAAGELVDPELFAAAQVTRAIIDAERLIARPERAWHWSAGVAVARRVERALDAAATATVRFVELAPGARTVARRAVTAAVHCLAAMRVVGVEAHTARAAAHAAFALCACGLAEREGRPFGDAAVELFARFAAGVTATRSGVDPHPMRACALVHAALLRPDAPRRWPSATRLVAAVYAMERARCPAKQTYDLTVTDVLAGALDAKELDVGDGWVAALVAAIGAFPPGVRVQMPDGRVGVVMGDGGVGDPTRPAVYVDGRIEVPDAPARLWLG